MGNKKKKSMLVVERVGSVLVRLPAFCVMCIPSHNPQCTTARTSPHHSHHVTGAPRIFYLKNSQGSLHTSPLSHTPLSPPHPRLPSPPFLHSNSTPITPIRFPCRRHYLRRCINTIQPYSTYPVSLHRLVPSQHVMSPHNTWIYSQCRCHVVQFLNSFHL